MEIYNSCGPILPSIESFISNSNSPAGSEDVMIPYGKLQTGYNLKEYPDGILDLEIKGLNPRTAPPFHKKLRYLRLIGYNLGFKWHDVTFTFKISSYHGF